MSSEIGPTGADNPAPADAAFEQFQTITAQRLLFRPDEGPLTEADTRAKLIDPLFKQVLGWYESEIRREKPVQKGYVDYVLGSDFSYLLIEAKRATPRFQLSTPQRPRRVKVGGPHILANKKVAPVIHQAQGYASDLGVQFCLVTNGHQVVVFRPYLPGRSWKQGSAIVFHDLKDIAEHFGEFHALLSRDRVLAGSLVEAFDDLERTTTSVYAPIGFVSDPDRELVRNHVWQQMARTMGPLLTDQPEDPAVQLEVIEHCYVTTPLADQTDRNLDALLRDIPKGELSKARITDLRPGTAGRTAFSHRMREDVQRGVYGAYILTGGVGSGKTTFLKRFAQLKERDFVTRFTVWVHINFLPIGTVDPRGMDAEVRRYTYLKIREELSASFGDQLASTGTQVRQLFADEISTAKLTLLHGIAEGTPRWNDIVNNLVDEHFRNDERFVFAALRTLRRAGRRIAIVLDNTDQLGESFQEHVFLFAQKLSKDFEALCVVTLREEKFFAAYRRGIFDAFSDRRFHIGSPDLKQVLRKRLEFGRTQFEALEKAEGTTFLSAEDFRRIDAILRALIQSTTQKNAHIVRMLATVSNGDMRHALDMFREFLSSGNTNIEKIIKIVERGGGYTVPFHEFAKSAILGSRQYYRSSLSHIVNLFKQSDAQAASHLTACRILARLSAAEGVASPHGEGFVATSTLLREYRESFGFADDLVQWCSEFLRRNLLESEPPRVGDLAKTDAVRITAAGSYYWRYLVRSFVYMDLVFIDTPITDVALAKRLGNMAEMVDMNVRFERVRAFIEYLAKKEEYELKVSAERVGPFCEGLVPQLRATIENEIRDIARKVKVVDIYGA